MGTEIRQGLKMMKYLTKPNCTIIIVTLTLLLITTTTLAQTGGGYDLSWSTVDGGGGESQDDKYTLTGTIGQPDTGVMSGDNYTLIGGFWTGGYVEKIYLPLILKNN